MARGLYSNRCAWPQLLPPEYEVDTITQYWVKALFSCIHYVPEWPWPIFFSEIGSRDPEIWKSWTFSFLKYEAITCRFSGPVARQTALPWQPFCASLVGRSSSRYPRSTNLIGLPGTELLQFFYMIRYATLLPWPLIFWPWGHVTRRHLCNSCAKFELDTTYRSRVRTTTICHWPPAWSLNF